MKKTFQPPMRSSRLPSVVLVFRSRRQRPGFCGTTRISLGRVVASAKCTHAQLQTFLIDDKDAEEESARDRSHDLKEKKDRGQGPGCRWGISPTLASPALHLNLSVYVCLWLLRHDSNRVSVSVCVCLTFSVQKTKLPLLPADPSGLGNCR